MTGMLFMVAVLTGACTLPAAETTTQLAAADAAPLAIASGPEPGQAVAPAGRTPRCSEHYTCCQESRLSQEKDGWGRSRCATCLDLCRVDGIWPYYTRGGDDCQWWQERYGNPSRECRNLVPRWP